MRTKSKNPYGGLETSGPWHTFSGGSAICPDGIVRRLKRVAIVADTFFSVPASVTVRGKTVSGYVTTGESLTDGKPIVVFHPYDYRKNADQFPKRHFISSSSLEFQAKYHCQQSGKSNLFGFKRTILERSELVRM